MPASARAKETPIEALPLEERIRRRAYELYVDRGNQSGSELDDWLQAEEEILQSQEEALGESWRGTAASHFPRFLGRARARIDFPHRIANSTPGLPWARVSPLEHLTGQLIASLNTVHLTHFRDILF